MSFTKKRIILFSLIILIIFLFIIKYYFEKNPSIKCQIFTDIHKRDMCYFGTDNANMLSENYIFISDPYLQYVSQRLRYRPHMIPFLVNKKNVTFFKSSLESCNKYDKYNKLYCVYKYVAFNAKNSLNKSKDICNEVNNSNLIDGCIFFIAASYSLSLYENTSEKIEAISNLCNETKNELWKAECFYVIADGLSMIEQSNEYYEEISLLCKKSTEIKDFLCFDHLAFALFQTSGYNQSKRFCELVDKKYKEECIQGIGFYFGISTNNETSSLCKDFKNNEYASCLTGLSKAIALRQDISPSKKISMCVLLPSTHKDFCFNKMMQLETLETSFLRYNDCNLFPENYSEICFSNFKKKLGIKFYLAKFFNMSPLELNLL